MNIFKLPFENVFCNYNNRCVRCFIKENDLWGGLCPECDKQAKDKLNKFQDEEKREKQRKIDNFKSIQNLLKNDNDKDLLLAWLISNSIESNTKVERITEIIEYLKEEIK